MERIFTWLMCAWLSLTGCTCWGQAELPPGSDFNVSSVTWQTYEDAHMDLIDTLCQVPGLKPHANKTLASGSITPTTGSVYVTSESGSTDDLTTIDGSNYVSGMLVLMATAGHTITVKETGNITLLSGSEVVITGLDRLWLIKDTADTWKEVNRNIATAATIAADGTITTPTSISATGNIDTQGTIQAGSGNVTITNATGNVLGSAIADGSIPSEKLEDNTGGREVFYVDDTWTCPAGVTEVLLIGVGGGGGGGGGGDGTDPGTNGTAGTDTIFTKDGEITVTFKAGGGGYAGQEDGDYSGSNGGDRDGQNGVCVPSGYSGNVGGGRGGLSIFGIVGSGGDGGIGYSGCSGGGGGSGTAKMTNNPTLKIATVIPGNVYTVDIGPGGGGGEGSSGSNDGEDGLSGALLIEW